MEVVVNALHPPHPSGSPLENIVADRRLLRVVMAILACAAGFSSTAGMLCLMEHAQIYQAIGAVMAGLAIAAGLFTFWDRILNIGIVLRDPGAVSANWILVVIGAIATTMLSSYFIVVAIAGPASQRIYLDESLMAFERALAVTWRNLSETRALLPTIRDQALRYELAAELEGLGEGTPRWGVGWVSRANSDIAASYRSLESAANAHLAQIEELYYRGKEMIRSARTEIVRGNLTKAEGDLLLQSTSALLGRDLDEMSKRDPLTAISAFTAVPMAIPQQTLTSAERDALDDLRRASRADVTRLHEDAERQRVNRRGIPSITFSGLSTHATVLVYAPRISWAWALGLGLDFLMVACAAVPLLASIELRRRGRDRTTMRRARAHGLLVGDRGVREGMGSLGARKANGSPFYAGKE
jgi:hypothetical protein